jgi:hypothetical protein
MAKANKAPQHDTPKTAEWFEHAVLHATPQTGILDGTDRGLWTLIEQSGLLAGLWRQHRTLGRDLDVAAVSNSLSECLAAIVHCAHVLDVSLESLMIQQIEQMQRTQTSRTTKPRKETSQSVAPRQPTPIRQQAAPSVAPEPPVSTKHRTPVAIGTAKPQKTSPASSQKGSDTPPSLPTVSRQKRTKQTTAIAANTLQPAERPQQTPPPLVATQEIPRKRGRPAKHTEPMASATPISAAPSTAPITQRRTAHRS